MAEKDKFDYLKDTDFGKFLEYGGFLEDDSIYNPYNLGTAIYDTAAVPMNKLSEIFTGYNLGLSGNRLFNRGDPNEAYFLGMPTDATPGFLNYEERMEEAKEKEKKRKDSPAPPTDRRQAGINKYEKPKTKFSINPNMDKFIGQENIMEKFKDPNYKPADPFQVAAEESFNPARITRGNMKLQQAIFDNEMKKGSKELKDVSKKKMDKYLKDKAEAETYASKSFLEKMFDKDVREGETISNADKSFAIMRAIGDSLLQPKDPGEARSFVTDVAKGLGEGADAITALEDKEYNRATAKTAADLESLMANAELMDIASKIQEREAGILRDDQLGVSQIAKNLRDASLIDPNSPQATDLLNNDIRSAMVVVQGKGLMPGQQGYQEALGLELSKQFDTETKVGLLGELTEEFLFQLPPDQQATMRALKVSIVNDVSQNMALVPGGSDNTINYKEEVVNN